MLNIVIEKPVSVLSRSLANDLGISRELAAEMIRDGGPVFGNERAPRLQAIRRVAGSALIEAGRLIGGRSLGERAGSAA